jgi:zinc protease
MEADRLENLILDEEVLKTERQVVLEERRLRTDNSPTGKMQESLWALSYRRHPYRWPVIGIPEDLLRMTAEDLKAFFKAHYQPANAALVVVGDIEPDKLYRLVNEKYGKIKAQPRPAREIEQEPEQQEERRLIIRDHVASERFAHAYHVTSASEDDSYALDVLANILFEGTTSRAYRRLVEEKDVVIGVSGSAYTPTYRGLFIVTASMKGELPAATAEKMLDEVISGVQEHGVTDEEIQVAVKQLTVQLVDSVRTPYGLGQLIGTVMTIFGDPKRFAEDLEKYLKVTRADVQRVAKQYLIPNNRSVVTLVPEKPESAVADGKPKAPEKKPASGKDLPGTRRKKGAGA